MTDQQTKPRSKEVVNDKIYFTEATELAIVRYNKSVDREEREQVFVAEIAYPLDKLSENIINRFKFPYVHNSFDDTKKQVVSFLVTNLSKYNPERGTKAFSYFSVVAKNYLIYLNNKGYEEEKRHISLSDGSTTEDPSVIDEVVANIEAPNEHEYDDVKEFITLMINYWENNVHKHFKKKRDIDIANAVIELFRRVEHIENFNKKALYLMIREITDCKTGYITKVVNKMKEIVQDHLKEFNSEGTVDSYNTTHLGYS